MKFATKAIHSGQKPDPLTGAVMTPVYLTSTYAQESPGKHRGYEYSRTQNPTRNCLQDCVADLENAKHGFAFGSGLGALSTFVLTLKKGDHILCCDDVYGGTYRLFDKVFKRHGIEFDYVDMTDLKGVSRSIKPTTKWLWVESPTNPLLKIIDIDQICHIAHSKNVKVAVDNTFMSPYFQRPLDLGADLVLHSGTKFLNGHSDVVCGFLVTNDSDLATSIAFHQNAVGAVLGPMDSFLVLRGLKTLHIRMKQHEENATKIANWLSSHSKVERVIYPGLENHPQHQIAKKQMSGFGGMITFFIKGDIVACRRFLENTRLFTLAESLGGVESLVDHPAIMTHASVPAEVRKQLGISDQLVRLSVGIEDVADLINDLSYALASLSKP
ncbi:MAG: cystathionine gamma-synthase [Bacteriovoracia bacterium]